jgi:hypothetical protein
VRLPATSLKAKSVEDTTTGTFIANTGFASFYTGTSTNDSSGAVTLTSRVRPPARLRLCCGRTIIS